MEQIVSSAFQFHSVSLKSGTPERPIRRFFELNANRTYSKLASPEGKKPKNDSGDHHHSRFVVETPFWSSS